MKKCIVFGAGTAYNYRSLHLNKKCIEVIAIIDNNQSKWGTKLDGLIVDSPQNILHYEYDYILIISSYYNDIHKQLIDMGVSENKILPLYMFLRQGMNVRLSVANYYICYDKGYKYGIEVGGAENPIQFIDGRIIVKQLDYCDRSIDSNEFVKVDIIDDGEKLSSINNDSLDYLVACHMIEHCKNPIGTIRNFMSKLRPGGILFLAVPDKRFTFDANRELTKMEHLILDDREPSSERDLFHYFDKEVNQLMESELKYMNELIDKDIRVHYHVWDSNSFIDFIYEVKKLLNNMIIEQVGNIDNGYETSEIICVIKKID